MTTRSIIAAKSVLEVAPVTNRNGLTRWYNALADAEREPARLWWTGNSVMDGVSTDATTTPSDADKDTFAAAAVLRNLFAREFGTTSGFVVPGFDTRWTNTGTQAQTTGTTVTGVGGERGVIMTSAATKTITTPHACTDMRIYYYANAGLGSFTYSIDGGGAVAVDGSAGSGDYLYITLTGLANATHTVVITATSSSCYFLGIEGSASRGVIVGKFGNAGRNFRHSTGKGLASAAGQLRAQRGFAMGAPDCVCIGFLRNDWKSQAAFPNTVEVPYSPAEYVADLENVYTQIAVTGCVLVVGECDDEHSETATGAAYGPNSYADFHNAAKAWAATKDHAAFIWLKDVYGTWAEGQARGFYRADTDEIHPGRIGQQKVGRLMHSILSSKTQP